MRFKHTHLNRIYSEMKQRCYNPNCKEYHRYGARGITVCDEWTNPEIIHIGSTHNTKGWLAFKEWALTHGYSDGLSIDRIDNNKGYSPENCQWVTLKQQGNNKRNNHLINYKGKTQTMAQWCDELHLKYRKIESRINRYHWSVERAFETK